MSNIIKKSLVLLLCAAILVPSLVSCGDNGVSGETEASDSISSDTAADATEESMGETLIYSPQIPDGTDFGGYEFRVVTNETSRYIWGDVDFTASELTGEVVNDVVYNRSRDTEERLNVKLTAVQSDGVLSYVTKTVTAGADEIDMAYTATHDAFTLAQSGLLRELTSTSLDIAAPWWDHNSASGLSVGGRVYMLTGDIGTMYKKSIGVIMFNKTIASQYGVGDPHESVRDGSWTLDALTAECALVSDDLNGDGSWDENDRYGLIYFCDMMGLAMIGCGVNYASKDEEDIPQITFWGDRCVSVFEKLTSVLYNPALCYSWSKNGVGEETALTMYRSDKALFYYGELHAAASMRDMASDFGILPMPKYDEAQKGYYHCVNPHVAPMVTVPVTADDTARTALVLDTLGAYSKNVLTPAYYETTLKGKVTRDEESSETLDIVLNSVRYDMGYLSNWGLTPLVLGLADKYGSDLSSAYEAVKTKVENARLKTVDMFLAA